MHAGEAQLLQEREGKTCRTVLLFISRHKRSQRHWSDLSERHCLCHIVQLPAAQVTASAVFVSDDCIPLCSFAQLN